MKRRSTGDPSGSLFPGNTRFHASNAASNSSIAPRSAMSPGIITPSTCASRKCSSAFTRNLKAASLVSLMWTSEMMPSLSGGAPAAAVSRPPAVANVAAAESLKNDLRVVFICTSFPCLFPQNRHPLPDDHPRARQTEAEVVADSTGSARTGQHVPSAAPWLR